MVASPPRRDPSVTSVTRGDLRRAVGGTAVRTATPALRHTPEAQPSMTNRQPTPENNNNQPHNHLLDASDPRHRVTESSDRLSTLTNDALCCLTYVQPTQRCFSDGNT